MARPKITTAARTLLATVALMAHPALASPQARFEPAFTSYGRAEGLPSTNVTAVLQDPKGFLWVGTYGGLYRFDGRTFKAHRARVRDATTLADDFVETLAAADSGRIWVGTQRGGLHLLDPFADTVRHFPLTGLGAWRLDASTGGGGGREGRQVSRIVPFDSGVVLLLTDVGLVRLDPASGDSVGTLPLGKLTEAAPHATALAPTQEGPALVAISDGSLAVVDEAGVVSSIPLALPDSIAVLQPVSDGYLAGTSPGVVYHLPPDLSGYREVLHLPPAEGTGRRLLDLLVAPDRGIWLATTQGAFQADLASSSVHRVGNGGGNRDLPNQRVADLAFDRTGVLWLCTWNGIASLHPASASMARLLSGEDLEGDGVISMADAGSGRVWIGAYAGGVQLLEGRRRGSPARISRPRSGGPPSESLVFGLAVGGSRLWVAAFTHGVWVQDGDGPARKVPILDTNGTEQNQAIYSVFVDHAGDVWAGSYSLGLLRFDESAGSFRPHRGVDPAAWDLGSDYVWPIDEDSKGHLWVGAFDGGVSMISPDRASAILYRAEPGGLGDDRVLTVFVDSWDQVWVGTEGGGLSQLDPVTGTWTSWTVDQGLPHDDVEGIQEDRSGRMWISTSDGLARYDRDSGEFLVFREPAGLAGNRFYANAAYRDGDGLLYFGGPAGITIVDPEAIEALGVPPQVSLTAFRIQGRDAPLARAVRTDLLDLEPNENFFAFEFAAMDFADVSQNRYRYRLEGLDPDWVDAGTEPVANYTSVPSGRYTFRVAARNSDGIWNHDALAIPIRVQAPFYKTLWFQSLVAVALLSLLVGFYTYRLRQLEARQRLRLEIAGKLHDDIGANLSTIALKAEMVRGAQGLDERRSEQLADVGRLARDTAGKVRETVWVVNTKYDTVAGLVGKMHDTADTLLAGVLPYGFAAPDNVPERRISMETRQNVHLLFKETLNNVVKHAGASRVDITVTLGPRNALGFRVVDDGVGFDPAAVREGNGQRLMRQRAEALRGTLRVTSAPGSGTTVELAARLR